MTDDLKSLSEKEKEEKIQSLREMINTAEQTMQSAKAMLLQLEGKKKVGRRKKVEDDEGNIVQGTFDGQLMIGTDGKQYPIPANYASKSKLVEGDFLKLTILPDGSFVYKQIGPTPRQNKIGIVGQDASGNYFVAVDGKPYKVLLASITYFDVQPGDQVSIVTSQDENAQWAAIEALLQHSTSPEATPSANTEVEDDQPKTATAILTGSNDDSDPTGDIVNENEDDDNKEDSDEGGDLSTTSEGDDVVDEWVPDIDAIEKEIRAEMQQPE